MPALSEHQSNQTCKLLLIGDSGSGKTGALAALANAGYNLFILDFDNGLDVLRFHVNSEGAKRVSFVTCTDDFRTVNGNLIARAPVHAWADAMKALDKWPDDGKSAFDRTPQDVLVIDSLTLNGSAALRHTLMLNNRLNQQPYQSDWGEAMNLQERLLELLYSNSTKANVVVTSHVTYVERENELTVGYPTALGSKLPPKIPRYFNTMVYMKSRGSGAGSKRVICTTPQPSIPVKVPAVGLPPELPIETGLATLFNAVRGTK